MDIATLAEQLNSEQQHVSQVLKKLNTISEEQINNQPSTRRSVLSNFVAFCEHQLQRNAYRHITVLFKVVHELNATDDWLLSAAELLLPKLQRFYNKIVVDVRMLESPIQQTPTLSRGPIQETPTLSRRLKRNKYALRTLSSIFELCVDFCDVVSAEAHVAEFMNPCFAMLSVSDFHAKSVTLTETDYALNELLRCASYALSNMLLSFDSVADSARKMPPRHIHNVFSVLSCAPELSIQRSLVMSLRRLCGVSYGHPSLHSAQSGMSSIEELIEQILSSNDLGSSRAIPSFRELDVNADDAVEKSEIVVTKMFWRRKKIHRNFKSKPCDVQILPMDQSSVEEGSSHEVVLRSVSVEWNTNAICIRDEDGNPFRQWPLFSVSHLEWADGGRELRLNMDAFYTYPATEVHVSFLAKSLTRYERKAIDERIEEIMSMATNILTPGISKGDLQKEPNSATPMSVSLFQKKQDCPSQAEAVHEESTERRREVETIFSKLNKDGLFLKKGCASSYAAWNENNSVGTSGAEVPVDVKEQTGPDYSEGSGDNTADHDMHSQLQGQDSEKFGADTDVVDKQHSDMEMGIVNKECSGMENRVADNECSDMEKGAADNECSDMEKSVADKKCSDMGKDVADKKCSDMGKGAADKECSDMEIVPKIGPLQTLQLSTSRKQKNKVRLRRNNERFASIQSSPVQTLSCQTEVTSPRDEHIEISSSPKDKTYPDVEHDEVENEKASYGKLSVLHEEYVLKGTSRNFKRKQAPSQVCISGDHVGKYPSTVKKSFRPKKRRRNLIRLSSDSSVIWGQRNGPSPEENPVDPNQRGGGTLFAPGLGSEGGNPGNELRGHLDIHEALGYANSTPSVECKLREKLAGLPGLSNKSNVKPESKTLRSILLSVIRHLANWQDDNSKRMLLSTKKEVETLRDKKKTADGEKLRALEATIKRRGKEQKAKIRQYGLRKREILIEAKNRLNELKLKALTIQKQVKRSKLRTKNSIEHTKHRLNELKEQTECVLGEMVAKIRKKERKTDKGSLLRNLKKILEES